MIIICATGTLATISYEADWLINPMLRVEAENTPIKWNKMQENFQTAYPSSTLSYIGSPLYPNFASIGLMQTPKGKNRRIFFNPYTGDIIGDLPWYASFQRVMRDLHRFLLIPVNLSLYFVSSFGFILLVSLMTGLFVYKKWWSGFFKLRLRRGNRILFGDFHRLIGIWSIPFIIVIGATGAWYFIERAGNDFNRVFYDASPTVSATTHVEAGDKAFIKIEEALSIAKKTIPGLTVSFVLLPLERDSKIRPYRISGQVDTMLVRARANRVFINPITGGVLEHHDSRESSLTTRVFESADPLHFGNFMGLSSKIVYFFFGLTLVGMSISGIWMWKNRNLKRKTRGLEYATFGLWKPLSISIVSLGVGSGLIAILFYTL